MERRKCISSLPFCILVMSWCIPSAQIEVPLNNPSFEGIPVDHRRQGFVFAVENWQDWGTMLFKNNSAPDVHAKSTHYWNVSTSPQHGETFVGLVTREDMTWECIAQQLQKPLKAGNHYLLSLYLCQDSGYKSPVKNEFGEFPKDANDVEVPFTNPVVVRIWGSNIKGSLDALMAESEPIAHQDWREYSFDLFPERYFSYLAIEVYYPPNTQPTAGHVLIDNARLVRFE